MRQMWIEQHTHSACSYTHTEREKEREEQKKREVILVFLSCIFVLAQEFPGYFQGVFRGVLSVFHGV